jgi:hypothetical protein
MGYGKVQATFTKLVYDKYSRWTFLCSPFEEIIYIEKMNMPMMHLTNVISY